ncbi:MAG: FtsX-like permease family protein, partial [Longimicrobiales bacterium]
LRGGRGTAGRERHRVRQLLIVGQMALALVLLVSAGLMLRSVAHLHAVDPGLRADGALAVGVSLGELRDRERTIVLYHRVLDEVAALPGAVSAGATNNLPIVLSASNGGSFAIESRPRGDDELPPISMWSAVTDGYFETLGIPRIDGRAPVRADAEGGRPVVWVNETFSRRFLDGRAVGERIRFGEDTVWAEIVGVVGDVREFGLNEEVRPAAYLPLSTMRPVQLDLMQLVIRTDGEPTALMPAIRAAVTRVDPSVPLTTLRTMDEVVASSLARTSFTVLLLGIAASVALVLGVVGLYGVISTIVSQRTAEIGIRIALGAQPAAVRALVLREGLGIGIAGVLIGLVAAAAVTRVLASLLFEVSARDPLTFVTVAVVLTTVSVVATYVPARRAMRMDPIAALRTE